MIKKGDSTSLLGAIGMGLCPVLTAIALSTIGLGVLAPIWMWLSAALLVAGLVGYMLDYRYHRQSTPVILFVAGCCSGSGVIRRWARQAGKVGQYGATAACSC